MPGEITVHEVVDMKKAFDLIDDDKSGHIDTDELQGAAVALGIPMEENISVLLGNDKISFEDFFKRMTAKLKPEDTVDDMMQIFELFDNDATGTISYDNLLNVGRIIGAKETQQQIMEICSTLDTDGDGEICPIDFYTCLIGGMRLRMAEEEKVAKAEADQIASQIRSQATNNLNRVQSGMSNR
jgi:centrin-1